MKFLVCLMAAVAVSQAMPADLTRPMWGEHEVNAVSPVSPAKVNLVLNINGAAGSELVNLIVNIDAPQEGGIVDKEPIAPPQILPILPEPEHPQVLPIFPEVEQPQILPWFPEGGIGTLPILPEVEQPQVLPIHPEVQQPQVLPWLPQGIQTLPFLPGKVTDDIGILPIYPEVPEE